MIRAPFDSGRAEVTTMEVTPVNTVARGVAEVEVRGGVVRRLPEDHVFVAVTGRHGQDRKPFVGVMKGLGLRSGAHGSTVAHDSHNLIVAGTNPADMLLVAHTLAACGGGFCLADEGEVLARVELPIAGLMAREPVEELGPKVAAYNARVADLRGQDLRPRSRRRRQPGADPTLRRSPAFATVVRWANTVAGRHSQAAVLCTGHNISTTFKRGPGLGRHCKEHLRALEVEPAKPWAGEPLACMLKCSRWRGFVYRRGDSLRMLA